MQAVPRSIVDRYAAAFAGQNVGFSARQITDYFGWYSPLVKPYDHYGVNPTRLELFVDSVYSLPNDQQYYALNDLAFIVHESRYEYPSEPLREELRTVLHSYISATPIGMGFSQVRETEFRKDWQTAHGRLLTNPAAAVTASRTLLETLFKTIITERGGAPDESGNLPRLLRQAEDAVGFLRPENQAEHQLLTGLASTIDAIASISNAAGDRHGTVAGVSLSDPHLAYLCVNAAGTVGLAFIKKHLFEPRVPNAEAHA